MKLFKEYSMADVMRNDSISIPPPPSEEELRTHYDENKEEFAVPAKIHLYEILVSDELLAQRLTKEIKSRDEFRRKAAELTERSGMRVKKGDLGYIERKWFAELFDAAWKTPMETVGGPVRTLRRYSIFYPIDRIPKEYKDFLDVKRDIQQKLQAERQQEAFAEWVSERKAITKIEVSYDDLWETIDMEAYASAETDTLSSP